MFLVAQKQRRNGVETRACILAVRVLNEPQRRIPFVKLKLAVWGDEERVVEAEAFYPHHKLARFQCGTLLRVRLRCDGKCQIIKSETPSVCTGMPAKKREGIISVQPGPVQSRAAHRRRLAFR